MIAIGKKSNGEIKEFHIHNLRFVKNVLQSSSEDLIELEIPNGTQNVFCAHNQIKHLNLPNSVNSIMCINNPIKEITLPKSIQKAYLPKNSIVTNIEDFKDNNNIIILFWDFNVDLPF